jgi:hypothetical protein
MKAAEETRVELEEDAAAPPETADEFVLTPEQDEDAPAEPPEEVGPTPEQDEGEQGEPERGFALKPLVPFSIQVAASALTFAGALLIAEAGVRGPRSLVGFGLFSLGFVAFDGLYRGRFGLRQVSLFFGWVAAGIGGWAVLVSALLVLLELPVGEEIRSLLIVAAACAATSSAAGLLSVRSWGLGYRLRERVRAVGAWVSERVSRRTESSPAPGFGSEPPWPPAGPAPED